MLLVAGIATVIFLGGWLSPFQRIPFLGALFAWVPGVIWFVLKLSLFVFTYFWMRATFPRYRYDQIMRLCWKILIPVTLVWIVVLGLAVEFHLAPWF